MKNKLIHRTTLTCPFCSFREKLLIPADYCLIAHRCANCNMPIKPAPGDCCVFCSYGDVRCIPRQKEQIRLSQKTDLSSTQATIPQRS